MRDIFSGIKKYFMQKSFRSIFLVLTAFLVVSCSVFYVSYWKLLYSNLSSKRQLIFETQAANISGNLDNCAKELLRIQRAIQDYKWISKYMSGYFSEEFSVYRCTEYCREIQNLTKSAQAVRQIAIIFPESKTAVTNASWTTIDDIVNYFWYNYKVDLANVIKDITWPISRDPVDTPPEYYMLNGYLVVLSKLEITTHPRGYALYMIPQYALNSMISDYVDITYDSRLIGLEASVTSDNESKTLTFLNTINQTVPQLNATNITFTSQVIPNWQYSIRFDNTWSEYEKGCILLSLVLEAIFFLGGMVLIFFIARYSYRPIERILRLLPSQENNTLSPTVEIAKQEFDSILSENESIRQKASLYLCLGKETAILRLLKGEMSQSEKIKIVDTLKIFGIELPENAVFIVAVVTLEQTDNCEYDTIPSEINKSCALNSWITKPDSEHLVMILCLSNESVEIGKRLSLSDIEAVLERCGLKNFGCSLGKTGKGINGIYESYKSLHRSSCIESLLEPSLILNESCDNGMENQENDCYQREIATEALLLEYVNTHYCDYSLSLKGLAQEFDISVSSVSRAFKRATGINFLDHITHLRMEKAKEFLSEGMSIHDTAIRVGYENDYSFRRAFERYEGVSLQDYRKRVHA